MEGRRKEEQEEGETKRETKYGTKVIVSWQKNSQKKERRARGRGSKQRKKVWHKGNCKLACANRTKFTHTAVNACTRALTKFSRLHGLPILLFFFFFSKKKKKKKKRAGGCALTRVFVKSPLTFW